MYKVILKGVILCAALFMTQGVLQAQNQSNSTNVEGESLIGESIETQSVVADTLIADQVVAIVGNSCILLSDVEQLAIQLQSQRQQMGSVSESTVQEDALEMLLSQYLMATRATLDSLDKTMNPIDDIIEQQVAKMTFEAGSVAELERIHGKPIYQIKSDLALEIKHMQLAQTMQKTISNSVEVNRQDVVDMVNNLKEEDKQLIPEQYSYSQIVKIPPQTDERKYEIRERMLGFRERILNKEISLGALAQLYSADMASAMYRGEMGPIETAYLDPAFSEAALALEPGEVSEIVESEYGYHLIELIAKTETTLHVRHILLKPEFTLEEEKAVISQLDSLSNVINQGVITFAQAALIYSDDIYTKQNGGKAFNKVGYQQSGNIRAATTYFAAEDMQYYPMDYSAVSSLKVSEISAPYESMDDKGNKVQKIIRLDSILPAHKANIVDDYDLLEAVTKAKKQADVIDKWVDEQTHLIYIEIKDEYLENYDFKRDSWKEAAMRTKNRENSNVKLPDYDELRKVAKERAAHNAAELAALERERAEIEAERRANGELDDALDQASQANEGEIVEGEAKEEKRGKGAEGKGRPERK